MSSSNPMHAALLLLRANYPSWYAEVGAKGIAAWAGQFSELSREAVAQAITAHCRTSPFPPKVSEIIEMARPDAGDTAWHAMERVSAGNATELDMRALMMPGCNWRDRQLDMTEADKRRASFRAAWAALRAGRRLDEAKHTQSIQSGLGIPIILGIKDGQDDA